MKYLLLVLACLQTACVPLAHHGPWVREGLSGDLLTGAGLLRGSGGDRLDFALGVDAAVRYGIVSSDSSSVGMALGLQAPVLPFLITAAEVDADFVELISGDIYFTLLKTDKLATSVGFTGSMFHKLPYVQVGSRLPNDGSWYTTQAILLRDDGLNMWLPSVTWITPSEDKPRVSHITVGGAIGNDDGNQSYMFLMGITLEFHRRDARVR